MKIFQRPFNNRNQSALRKTETVYLSEWDDIQKLYNILLGTYGLSSSQTLIHINDRDNRQMERAKS